MNIDWETILGDDSYDDRVYDAFRWEHAHPETGEPYWEDDASAREAAGAQSVPLSDELDDDGLPF